MQGVPWTKFQDFYLRLGFLKVLVAALSPSRRSVTNEAVYQKLENPAFRPLQNFAELYERSADRLDKNDKRKAKGRPYALEGLLIANDCQSWLFAITADTVYKILDWGHDVDFVGRGNQISERGLILRSLLSSDADRFLAGDINAWNPFVLTRKEQLFFLYHLIDIDRVTLRLIEYLAMEEPGAALESSHVAKLTCRALFGVLEDAKQKLSPAQVPQFRVAYELAKAIAQELEMGEFLPNNSQPIAGVRRLPKPPKIVKRATATLQMSSTKRRPSKNADHQTIPRCEQLVDLGFLAKPHEEGSTPPQRRWQYTPTELCRRWAAVFRDCPTGQNFLWDGFATAAISSLGSRGIAATAPDEIVRFFSDAYDAVRRPIGHTPFDSVALRAMLDAAASGTAIEVSTFHKLVLALKTKNLLPEHAFFAAGNEVDKMFINLRPGYREKLLEIAPLVLNEASQ
jgi:hypothetical protein